jgi:hypothetical protein
MTIQPRTETPTPAAKRLRARIETARQRVETEAPFSPSWDAAMAALEDAERELWRLEQAALDRA